MCATVRDQNHTRVPSGHAHRELRSCSGGHLHLVERLAFRKPELKGAISVKTKSTDPITTRNVATCEHKFTEVRRGHVSLRRGHHYAYVVIWLRLDAQTRLGDPLRQVTQPKRDCVKLERGVVVEVGALVHLKRAVLRR